MSIGKLVIQIYESLYYLYCEIQKSSEDIKGFYLKPQISGEAIKDKSGYDKQKAIIKKLNKKN